VRKTKAYKASLLIPQLGDPRGIMVRWGSMLLDKTRRQRVTRGACPTGPSWPGWTASTPCCWTRECCWLYLVGN